MVGISIEHSSVRCHWYDLIVEEGKYDPLMYQKCFLESRHKCHGTKHQLVFTGVIGHHPCPTGTYSALNRYCKNTWESMEWKPSISGKGKGLFGFKKRSREEYSCTTRDRRKRAVEMKGKSPHYVFLRNVAAIFRNHI